MTNRPVTRMKKWNQFSQFRRSSTNVIPTEIDLNWLQFEDDPNVQEILKWGTNSPKYLCL